MIRVASHNSQALSSLQVGMDNLKAIVHAGSCQEVRLGGTPLQSPHTTTNAQLLEWMLKVSGVPDVHSFIITAEGIYTAKNYFFSLSMNADSIDCTCLRLDSEGTQDESVDCTLP